MSLWLTKEDENVILLLRLDRGIAEAWIARTSRAMTIGGQGNDKLNPLVKIH